MGRMHGILVATVVALAVLARSGNGWTKNEKPAARPGANEAAAETKEAEQAPVPRSNAGDAHVPHDPKPPPAVSRLRLSDEAVSAALSCGGFVFLGKLIDFEVTYRGTRSQGTLCTFLLKKHLAGPPPDGKTVSTPCGRAFAKRLGRVFIAIAGIHRAPWDVLEKGREYVVVPPGRERQASAANADLDALPRSVSPEDCSGF